MIQNDDCNSRTILAEEKEKKPPKYWVQHIGALIACLSAFAVGNTLGWSSPAGPLLVKGSLGFPVSEKENSLIGSLLTIGAAVSCLPTGYVTDKIGRKITLLCLIPIFLLGWILIIFANFVEMIYAGRFLLGVCAGAACVTAPVFTAEICQKEIRGTVGSYFQLLLAGGILFVYVVGSQLEVFWFSVVCVMVPITFGILFSFFPDTPVYYTTKGAVEKARNSLKFFRGKNYDLEPELNELSGFPEQRPEQDESEYEVFMSKQGLKSLYMSVGMMVFQQLSGINAFVFNATDIFEHAGSFIESKYETIIIGVMQVVGTLFATFLVDYIGRVALLSISAFFMSICTFFLGLYFFFSDQNFNVDEFSWLPLVCLCTFIIMFSVGYGAVPWMLMPELIPSKIKGIASSIACVVNWLSAFIVTKFFADLINIFGRGVTFWIFSFVSVLATIFSFKVLPETKGKSFEEIQHELLTGVIQR